MATDQEILATVRERFGITFNETCTGGGCMALESRLESGHWLVATDEGLCGFRERLEYESEIINDDGDTRALGWFIGIYPNDTTNDGIDTWFGADDAIVSVCDYDAYADALPDMIQRVLAQLVNSR